MRSSWEAGNVAVAADIAQSQADNEPSSADYVIWRLEEASAKRYLDEFAGSNLALTQANARIQEYDEGPEVSILNETKANFTNQSFLPYQGYHYDRIMMNAYFALNFWQMGQIENARVALNRVYVRQQEAVRENAEAISAANQAAADESRLAARDPKGDRYYNVDRARNDSQFSSQITSNYGYLDEVRNYGDYVNPFAVFLDGLIHLTNNLEFNDLERSRKSFQRVVAMAPFNEYLKDDLDLVEARLRGEPMPSMTYVIFETGMAPSRDQISINIPLFIVTREVPYVGVAFPQLRFNGNYAPALIVESEGYSTETALVCDMDAVIATEFDQRLPLVIIKTLISAGTKAAAQYGLQEAAKDNKYAYWGVVIAGSIYQASMNQADLRTWVTLPKQFQYCRIPTPVSGQLNLKAVGSSQPVTIDLPGAGVNLVYVKSNSRYSPLIIQQNSLVPLQPVNAPRSKATNTAQL